MQSEVDAIVAAVSHPIPPLDSPYSSNAWQQPKREEIEIDDQHAVMTMATYRQLAGYDRSYPSGVYPGKMWRRDEGFIQYLCWYGYVPGEPKRCSINHRVILLVD